MISAVTPHSPEVAYVGFLLSLGFNWFEIPALTFEQLLEFVGGQYKELGPLCLNCLLRSLSERISNFKVV